MCTAAFNKMLQYLSIVAVLKMLQHTHTHTHSYVIMFFKNVAIDYLLQRFLELLHWILNK